MPELPEVETVCRGLQPHMEGRRIQQVEQRRPDLRYPFPDRFAARLEGRTIRALRRRAKFLLIELDDRTNWMVHLGMSGRFTINADQAQAHTAQAGRADWPLIEKHDHVRIRLEDGTVITFNDPRRFGFMDLIAPEALDTHPSLAALGPEPLGNGFNGLYLSEALAGRKSPIKTALLDQRLVAGLGNIYVCEALWRAGISPRRTAATVPGRRAERLAPAIRAVLEDAIAAGGSSLRDYRQADGELGYFQHRFDVYDRAGRACRREGCTGAIQRIVQSNRSTFYCPAHQR